MNKLFTFLFIFVFYTQVAYNQVAINTAGNTAAPSAMLDVSSTNKGMLLPRMTTAQRNAIQNPEKGLLVFDTDRETIYLFNGQTWKLMMTASEEAAPLSSRQVEGAKPHSEFGKSADIQDNYVVVGAPLDTTKGVIGGAAYVFVKDAGGWQQLAKLTAPNPSDYDHFGESVSIHGDLIIVGAPDKDFGGQNANGAVYIFKRFNRLWNYVAMVTSSNGKTGDYLGTSVSTNGTYVVAGAPGTDHNGKTNAGSVYVFGLQNNNWTQKAILNATDPTTHADFGFSIGFLQSTLVVGATGALSPLTDANPDGGAIYIFNNTDAGGFFWAFKQKLYPGATHDKMKFGYSIAIEDNLMVVGAPDYSGVGNWPNPNYGVGGIFWFKFDNGEWKQIGSYTVANEVHRLGNTVACSNGAILSGMPGSDNGRGKVFIRNQTYKYIYNDNLHEATNFGTVVAAHNGQFIVTSPSNSREGRIYFGLLE